MRRATIPLVLVLVTFNSHSADVTTATTISRVMKIPPAEISIKHAKDLAKHFFQEAAGRKLISLMMVPNTPKWNLGIMGASDVDSYYLWRTQYDGVVDYTEPLASAIQIDGNAVLLLRDRHANESRIVLAGSDPLIFDRDGLHGEIMQFQWYGRGDHLTLQVLIKTERQIAEELARELTKEYAVRLGLTSIDLVFRTDCWFISEGFYPHFLGCGSPPSEDEIRGTASLHCSVFNDSARCRTFPWDWGKR